MRTARVPALIVTSAAVLGAPLHASPASAAKRLPGLDAAEYQGTVDWSRVAASGRRFVIARATKGNDYADPMYATYETDAMTAGLRFTAYHYAKPNLEQGDAVAEANFFLANADLSSGNLIPALDLEQAGGLGPSKLKAWVSTWLRHVGNALGVKPMIYTSPSFWRGSMGDTRRFAKNGYPLWVANWFVKQPDVPARNWSGRGWTFWQYSDRGHIPGISGRVDLDRFNGKTFAKVHIP